jgi:hypothetical protein
MACIRDEASGTPVGTGFRGGRRGDAESTTSRATVGATRAKGSAEDCELISGGCNGGERDIAAGNRAPATFSVARAW